MVYRAISILIALHVLACPLWCALTEARDHHHAPHSNSEGSHKNDCSVEPCFCTANVVRIADRLPLPSVTEYVAVLCDAGFHSVASRGRAFIAGDLYFHHGPPPELRLPLLI